MHDSDSRYHAGGRRIVIIHAVGRERGEFKKRRVRIEEPRQALAHRQLATLDMTFNARLRPGRGSQRLKILTKSGDQRFHRRDIRLKVRIRRTENRFKFLQEPGRLSNDQFIASTAAAAHKSAGLRPCPKT